MPEPVVVVESVYRKGERVFESYRDRIAWHASAEPEEEVAAAVRESGARVAVLGTEGYRGVLYGELARGAHGGHALIARFGVGFDGIDLEQCKRRGVFLTITRGALDQSVAEHAMALLLALARDISRLDRRTRAGSWGSSPGIELAGKPLGVAGFGAIGRKLSLIASRGFGMSIRAFDCATLGEQAGRDGTGPAEFLDRYRIGSYHTDFSAFARGTRLVSVHMPVRPETIGYFNRERLAILEPGTILVNTGRGALFDETALCEALASGQLLAAGLDVYQNEPYRPIAPHADLRTFDNVILTPHVASNTEEANRAMATMVTESIHSFCDGQFDKLPRVV